MGRLRVAIGFIGWLVWPALVGAQASPITGQDVRAFDLVYETEVQDIPSGTSRVDVQDTHSSGRPATRKSSPSRSARRMAGPFTPTTSMATRSCTSASPLTPTCARFRSHCVSASGDKHTVHPDAADTSVPVLPGQRWLQPDRLVPLDERIRGIAAEVTAGAKTPLEKARAIYDYVVDTMVYDTSGTGWGNGDIYWACDVKTGNCTDFHALFVGLNRAVGIPATFEIGFSLPPDRSAGQIEGYHCWAQFYLDGVGWVPVDTSEANKHPDKREYFFGAHDPHRVLFTLGRDITLQPPQQGPPLNYFIYSYVEVDGKPFDQIAHRFHFQDVVIASESETPDG